MNVSEGLGLSPARDEAAVREESPLPPLVALGMGSGASAASAVHTGSKRGELASAEEGKGMIQGLIEEELVSVSTALWKWILPNKPDFVL